jgi:adenylate kinase
VLRIVLLRPPGSRGKEIALSLAEYLSEQAGNITCISVGDLIDKEINKRSSFGKEIEQCRQTYSYVKDEIVIELLKLQVQQMENEQRSYIIEGFPRTETQAIAMQKMGILPDNFILLNQSDNYSVQRIRDILSSDDTIVKCEESNIERYANHAIRECNVHMQGVKEVCRGLITELDGTKSQ